jgi:DNA-directed RNA polymerase subunit RPC12/RpoP
MKLSAPRPIFLESPCSWITRAAAHNGVAPVNFICFIGVSPASDIDMAWSTDLARDVARSCCVPHASFQATRRLLRGVKKLNMADRLLLSHHGLPRYRYCRECLKEQPRRGAVHMPLHWRFSNYRWCKSHQRLLEDRCSQCGAFVILPVNILHALDAKRRPELDACAVCGFKLTVKGRAGRFSGLQKFVSPEEARLLRNGLAAMSALWNGRVQIEGRSDVFPLTYLSKLEREGHLPNREMRFDRLDLREVSYRQPWTDRVVRESMSARTLNAELFG